MTDWALYSKLRRRSWHKSWSPGGAAEPGLCHQLLHSLGWTMQLHLEAPAAKQCSWVEPSAQPGTVRVYTGLGFPTCASTGTLFLLTCSAQRCCCTGPLPPSLCGHACSQLAHTAWYTGTCPSPALRSHKRCVGAAFRMSPHCPEACSLPTVPTACPNPTPLSCTGSRQAPPARLTSHWPAHSTLLHLSRLLCRAQLSITTEAG